SKPAGKHNGTINLKSGEVAVKNDSIQSGKFVMKIVLGEMHQILFSSQHVSCRKLLDLKYQFKFASLDKALNDLLK
ncbi:MAG: DUF1731 domain-containing protein, partial [Flavobacterium sp.]